MNLKDIGLANLIGRVKSIHRDRAELVKELEGIVERYREREQSISLNQRNAVAEVIGFQQGVVSLKIVESYDLYGKLIESSIEKGMSTGKTDYLYNEAGKLIAHSHYNRRGELEERADYVYNLDGELAEIKYQDNKHQLRKRVCYFYTPGNGRTVETFIYGDEGYQYLESMLVYDSGNRLIESISYNEDGSQSLKRVRSYNGAGNCVEQTCYGSDSSDIVRQRWEYDLKGFPIREIEFSVDGEKVEEYSIDNEVDMVGNWVKRTMLRVFTRKEENSPYVGTVYYRTITYWD